MPNENSLEPQGDSQQRRRAAVNPGQQTVETLLQVQQPAFGGQVIVPGGQAITGSDWED
ncbi:hypothetical protein D3C81_2133340 [compost metagenome]